LCNRFGVKGFPVVKVLNEGMEWTYDGPRTKEGLQTLLERMRNPSIRELTSASELEAALASAREPVSFFGGRTEAAATDYAAFAKVARMLQHKESFSSSRDAKVLAAASANAMVKPPFVARLEKGEEPRLLTGEGATSVEGIEQFIERERVPTFSAIDHTNFHVLANAGRPLVTLVTTPVAQGASMVSVADCDVAGSPAANLRALAREAAHRSALVFGVLDAKENEEHVRTTYNVTADDTPRLIVLRKVGGYRQFALSTPEEASDAAAMRAFLARLIADEVSFEYEGMWGRPARFWRVAKSYVPQLEHLDFLPNFSLVAAAASVPILIVLKLLMYDPLTAPSITQADVARQYQQMQKDKKKM
jgi:hypothetical protein